MGRTSYSLIKLPGESLVSVSNLAYVAKLLTLMKARFYHSTESECSQRKVTVLCEHSGSVSILILCCEIAFPFKAAVTDTMLAKITAISCSKYFTSLDYRNYNWIFVCIQKEVHLPGMWLCWHLNTHVHYRISCVSNNYARTRAG